MARILRLLVAVLVLVAAALGKSRDPLSPTETDQLKQVAVQPGKRLELYIRFAEVRLTNLDQLRSNASLAEGRGKRIHDLLEDFTAILDEIDDNLDIYEGRPLSNADRTEFHRGLKEVIEASDRFESRLKALKSASETDPQTEKEAPQFRPVLQDAMDALKSTGDMAREYLGENKDTSKK